MTETLYEEAEKADGLVLHRVKLATDAGKMEALIKDFAGKKPMMGDLLGASEAIADFWR